MKEGQERNMDTSACGKIIKKEKKKKEEETSQMPVANEEWLPKSGKQTNGTKWPTSQREGKDGKNDEERSRRKRDGRKSTTPTHWKLMGTPWLWGNVTKAGNAESMYAMYHTMITTTTWQQMFMNKNEVGVGGGEGGGEGEGQRWIEGVVVRGWMEGGTGVVVRWEKCVVVMGGRDKEGGWGVMLRAVGWMEGWHLWWWGGKWRGVGGGEV